jgi:hypothetical protein
VATDRSNPRFQFSLRALFISVLVVAIAIVSWRLLVGLSLALFYPFAAVLLIASWWLGQRSRGRADEEDDHGRPRFSMLRVTLVVAVAVCLLSLWVRHRWVVWPWDDTWPRPFPYPDELLYAFHEWLDSLFPAPGYIKIHGEFYTGLIALNAAALCLCALVGGLLGRVCRTTGPLGITYWRGRIARVFRKTT